MLPIKRDLVQNSLDKLPNQFYNRETITTLLSTYINELKVGGDQIFDIVNSVNILDASGYLLDCVGSYVAVLRNSDDDVAYRARIQRKILSATSEGTPNEILSSLAFVTQGKTNIWEHFPVASHFSTEGIVIPADLVTFLQDASPATSGDIVVYINPQITNTVPSELGFEVLKLADENLDIFQTNNNETIVVNNLIYGGADSLYAELSEFTYGWGSGADSGRPDGLGELCEIVATDGGVEFYNYEYVQLADTVNDWWFAMNFTVPEDFS